MLANSPLITMDLHCFVTGWLQQTSFKVSATLSDMVYSMSLPKLLQNCHRSCKHTKNQGDGGGAKGGFQKPVPIGGGGGGGGLAAPIMMSRPEITRRFWEYFKAHQLQDPADKRCSVHYCSWSSASQCGLKGQDAIGTAVHGSHGLFRLWVCPLVAAARRAHVHFRAWLLGLLSALCN
jgi:hypothetical protein